MEEPKVKYLYPKVRKEYLRNAEKLKALYERLEKYFYIVQPYCPSIHIKQDIDKLLEEQFKIIEKANLSITVKENNNKKKNKFKDGFYEMQSKSYYRMRTMIKSVANSTKNN